MDNSVLFYIFRISSTAYYTGRGPIIVKHHASWSCVFWHQDVIAFFAESLRQKLCCRHHNCENTCRKFMHQNTSFNPTRRLPRVGGSRVKPFSSKKTSDGLKCSLRAFPTWFTAIFTCYGYFRLIRGCKTTSCTTTGSRFVKSHGFCINAI